MKGNIKKGVGNWIKRNLKQPWNSKYKERRRNKNEKKPKQSLNSKYEEMRRKINERKPYKTLELEILRKANEYKWKKKQSWNEKYEKIRIKNEKGTQKSPGSRNMKECRIFKNGTRNMKKGEGI